MGQARAARHPGFRVVPALGRPSSRGRGRRGGEWASVTGRRPRSLSSVPSPVSPALSRGDTGQEAGRPAFPPSLPPGLQGHSARGGGPVVPALASGASGHLALPRGSSFTACAAASR